MNAPTAAIDDGEIEAFDAVDQVMIAAGPDAMLGVLIAGLEARGEFRALLDALLLKARFDLGLPLVQIGSLADTPEPARSQYEDRYVESIRKVGGLVLGSGDLVAAWPYFRVIGEKEPIARAIEAFVPDPDADPERLGQVIDVAFNQGVHPRKGYELILEHYGACSAITAFEHLPPDEPTRIACADRLVRHLHAHLVVNLREEISRRGQPLPPEGTSIGDLIAGRDWMFIDDAYHLDVSHLGAVVRASPILTDPATIALAVGLTEYGRNLSDRHRYGGEPPFDNLYDDHAYYLRALLGEDVETAIGHFLAKLPATDDGNPDDARTADTMPAQVLVRLLLRVGRADRAIDVAVDRLTGLPESMLTCPGIAQLCRIAGRPDRLAKIARDRGDVVNYAAAVLQSSEPPGE